MDQCPVGSMPLGPIPMESMPMVSVPWGVSLKDETPIDQCPMGSMLLGINAPWDSCPWVETP